MQTNYDGDERGLNKCYAKKLLFNRGIYSKKVVSGGGVFYWIISKRVGVILRVQGAKDSRVQVKYFIFSLSLKFNSSALACVFRFVY